MSVRAMNWAYDRVEAVEMTPKAAQVLCALAWFHNQETGRCDPGLARLVARTRLSERAVRNAIRELEEVSVLRTVHRTIRTGRGKRNLTNRYAFNGMSYSGAPRAGGMGHDVPAKGNTLPSAFDDLAMLIDDGISSHGVGNGEGWA